MELNTIIYLVTMVVTWGLGVISKKYTKLNNKLIPIQNILIGVIVTLVEWAITKDLNAAIALSGVMAGGLYDIFHNLKKLAEGE